MPLVEAPLRRAKSWEQVPRIAQRSAPAAAKGKVTWTASCASCHGADARGTEKGEEPDPIADRAARSEWQRNRAVSQERASPGAAPATPLTDTQIGELAQFLRQRVNDSFRGSPNFEPRNVLTGNPKAGETFFNGAVCVVPLAHRGLAGIEQVRRGNRVPGNGWSSRVRRRAGAARPPAVEGNDDRHGRAEVGALCPECW